MRQGDSDKNIGVVLLEGSVNAYSIDRANQKITHARRGNIIVHPEIPELLPDEEYILKWKVFVHTGTKDFFQKLGNKNLDLHIDRYTVMGDEEFCFDFKGNNAEIECDGMPVNFEVSNGRVFVKYKPGRLGKHVFKICRFVNDVLQNFLKNFAVAKESLDIIDRCLPIKRAHRKLVVFIVMYL